MTHKYPPGQSLLPQIRHRTMMGQRLMVLGALVSWTPLRLWRQRHCCNGIFVKLLRQLVIYAAAQNQEVVILEAAQKIAQTMAPAARK